MANEPLPEPPPPWEDLDRTGVQSYLRAWNLCSGGKNAVLRRRYSSARTHRLQAILSPKTFQHDDQVQEPLPPPLLPPHTPQEPSPLSQVTVPLIPVSKCLDGLSDVLTMRSLPHMRVAKNDDFPRALEIAVFEVPNTSEVSISQSITPASLQEFSPTIRLREPPPALVPPDDPLPPDFGEDFLRTIPPDPGEPLAPPKTQDNKTQDKIPKYSPVDLLSSRCVVHCYYVAFFTPTRVAEITLASRRVASCSTRLFFLSRSIPPDPGELLTPPKNEVMILKFSHVGLLAFCWVVHCCYVAFLTLHAWQTQLWLLFISQAGPHDLSLFQDQVLPDPKMLLAPFKNQVKILKLLMFAFKSPYRALDTFHAG